MIRWIKDNLNMIRIMNSCDYQEFAYLLSDLIRRPECNKFFLSKRYIWNLIRPRDFYKMTAMWIIEKIKVAQDESSSSTFAEAESVIKLVLKSTKHYQIRKSFIWNIMKKCPLITVDTIQYASAEKLHYLLTGDKPIICDDIMRPIIDVIMEYRDHLKAYEVMVEGDV
jgi:hypothetical protein